MDELHTGRPPTLSKNQLSEIDKDIRLDPQSLGYSQNLWDGKLLGHHTFNKLSNREIRFVIARSLSEISSF